ncbi:MAG: hypothetical protein JSS83_10845 [Cyanobacteria bacterium SZAS LIN-3]|nr:hypothetical protein [Cyanobacteria bacterium SZAS LIN-3]MBS2006042.1 hypothetical protein [Cyanobacteria bacterium SZAS TMP-1]
MPRSSSQAVASFLYEAGLLIVSSDNSQVSCASEGALASCREVLLYDPEQEGESQGALNKSVRRVYKLTFGC